MTASRGRTWLDSWLIPLLLAVAGGLALAMLQLPAEEQQAKTDDAEAAAGTGPAHTITTADGVGLAADFAAPDSGEMLPSVILVHGFTYDRHQWDDIVPKLLDRGFAVLSYDSRGAGESPIPSQPDTAEHFSSMTQDVAAAVDELRRRPNLDPARISLIGAGIGGNLAYVASGSGLPLHRFVALSPSFASGFLTGDRVDAFAPANILAMAHERHRADVETIMAKSADPKKSVVVTAEEIHGAELLRDDARFDEVIAWIK